MKMPKKTSKVMRLNFFFSRMTPLFGLLVLLAVLMISPEQVLAGDCMACHEKHGVMIRKPSVSPIKLKVDGKEQCITLERAFAFHGHECPGVTIAYRAVQYGIERLSPGETPDRDDLLITSRTSAAGVKDFIDLVMKGDNPAKKTWPPVNMGKSRDGFDFLLMKKSTCQAVEIKLLPENFPADFYLLKQKQKDKTITNEESDRLHRYMKKILLEFPHVPADELFGQPEPYKMILWGTVLPGEQDKNIRKMRQEEKKNLVTHFTPEI
ncbi:FmdE family protein [Trichloromonas sp.]|uniref:FmdE family protein n=1 Tax=Trichloromonas sp. TaxID=3069249 RepID=UPI002A3EBE18|nr:FmdE family protein [Trichloromonas sp.]